MPVESVDLAVPVEIAPGGTRASHPAPPSTAGRPRPTKRILTVTYLVTLIVIAGATPIYAKDAMEEMPPYTTGLVRFSLAALLLTITFAARNGGIKALWQGFDRRDVPRLLLASAMCVPGNQAFFLGGVSKAPASHAGLLYAIGPVLMYALTLALRTVRYSGRMALASAVAVVAAAVIGIDGILRDATGQFFTGDVFLFFAVLVWCIYLIAAKPLTLRYGSLRVLTASMIIGCVMYSPIALVDGARLHFEALSGRAWFGFVFITVLTAYFNYMLYAYLIRHMDLNRFSIACNAAPIIAVVLAHSMRGEPISQWLGVASALIGIAITLANWDALLSLFGAARAGASNVPAA